MAILLDLKAAIFYYGTMLADNSAMGTNCATLFHFGESDKHSPLHVIESVEQNMPDAECHVYDAGHAFANDARFGFFIKEATRLARQSSLDFINHAHGT